jgi:micrococcal nuclease
MNRLLRMEAKTLATLALVLITFLAGGSAAFGFHPFETRENDKGMDAALVAMLNQSSTTQQFKVAKVVDGDTFVVEVLGGKATIRVMGINTPETVDPRKSVQCYGPEASARAHELLDGQTISLALDHTQDSLDKYDRVLAYVILPDGSSYNEKMVAEGFAFEYTYKKAYEQQTEFRAAQKQAKTAVLGLWATSTCNGKTVPRNAT